MAILRIRRLQSGAELEQWSIEAARLPPDKLRQVHTRAARPQRAKAQSKGVKFI